MTAAPLWRAWSPEAQSGEVTGTVGGVLQFGLRSWRWGRREVMVVRACCRWWAWSWEASISAGLVVIGPQAWET